MARTLWGGVINIQTRRHKAKGRRTQARVMYGSYNTQKYLINNGYNKGKLSTFVSVNHDRTDGHRENAAFRQTNTFAKIGYEASEHFSTMADASIAKSWGQNPGMETQLLADNTMNVLRGTASFALENSYDQSSGALRLFYNWGRHKINDGYAIDGGSPLPYMFHPFDNNYGALLYQTFRSFKGNSFTLGLDYKNWGGKAWQDSTNNARYDMIDKSVREVAGYFIMQQDVADRLSLNAGVRFEHNSTFGGEWIPQAGITYRAFEGNTLRASFSKGFRSPNIREMYMFPPQNADLKPEQLFNYEVSIEQFFLEDLLRAKLTGFYIDGKDMIQVVFADGKPKNQNTGVFTNKGFEAELDWRIMSGLNLAMHYSYLHTDKPLLAAPKHRFVANATYAIGGLSFNAYAQSVSGLYLNVKTEEQTAYATLNAKAAYTFKPEQCDLILFLKGENLTATRYSINEGFPMPKAVFFAGVDVSF